MNPDDIPRRLARLEAECAVRQVAMRYFRLCDTLGPDTSMDELGAIFTADALWEGRGRYRKAFGRHEGRDAVKAMLGRYAETGHFTLNAHYLSSEAIVVDGDASAMGNWMLLQVSTYRDGRSDLRSAAIAIDFRFEDGAWRIARFVTEAIFARDVGPWNDEAEISVPSAPDSEQDKERA